MKTKRYELLIKINVVFLIILYSTAGLSAQSVFWGEDGLSLWYTEDDEKVEEILKQLKQKMAPNDAQIKAADQTNDPIERLRVRKIVVKRSQKCSHTAKKYDDYSKSKEYEDYGYNIEKNIPAIKADIYLKLEEFERNMAGYKTEIEEAKGKAPLEELAVLLNIFLKSRNAADFSHRFTTIADEDHKRMERFRNYQHMIEEKIKRRKNKIYDNLTNIMAPNDTEIEESRKNNFEEQIRVLQMIIERSKNVEEIMNNFIQLTNEGHSIRDLYHNYLLYAERLSADVQKKLKEESDRQAREEEERRRENIRLMNDAKSSFEQEGRRYESYFKMDQNKEDISNADKNGNIENQINVRKDVIDRSENAVRAGEAFIEVVNAWNNKWGAYERIGGDHAWAVESIRKKVAEYGHYKHGLEQELPELEWQFAEQKRKEEKLRQAEEQQRLQEEARQNEKSNSQAEEEVNVEKEQEEQGIKEEIIIEDHESNTELNQITQEEEIISLKSINVDLATGNIVFALQSASHNIFIESNLELIKQYIEKTNFREISTKLPQIEGDNLPIFGLENESDEMIKFIVSHITNVLPIFRTMDSVTKLISNYEEGVAESPLITAWNIDEIKFKTGRKVWKKRDKYDEIKNSQGKYELQ